jgi:hypothetical protein
MNRREYYSPGVRVVLFEGGFDLVAVKKLLWWLGDGLTLAPKSHPLRDPLAAHLLEREPKR